MYRIMYKKNNLNSIKVSSMKNQFLSHKESKSCSRDTYQCLSMTIKKMKKILANFEAFFLRPTSSKSMNLNKISFLLQAVMENLLLRRPHKKN